ncbi:hypothetical protein FOL47_002571 [Perkinsus chesapeaki]|uniref:Uncharacterized protein n=1 Tax=Perkinsus chesapeaki TaxID=330153 RepID=A0A7J6KQX7_PERCH|nr:hypothetical protein FOL47_002571 [Perkinsus chesapeaki]
MAGCSPLTPFSKSSMGFVSYMMLVLFSVLVVSTGNPFIFLTPFFRGVGTCPPFENLGATALPSLDDNTMRVVLRSGGSYSGFNLTYSADPPSPGDPKKTTLKLAPCQNQNHRFILRLENLGFADLKKDCSDVFFVVVQESTGEHQLTLKVQNASLDLDLYYCDEPRTGTHPCL